MKKAFTTAELLIGLVIIGVIASLILPQLSERYVKNLYTARIKKTYTTLTSAIEQACIDNGVSTFAQTKYGQCESYRSEFLTKYMHGYSGWNFGQQYRSIKKSDSGYNTSTKIEVSPGADWTLEDGTTLDMFKKSNLCIMAIDTNGPDKPNIAGRDLFKLVIDPETNEVRDYTQDASACTTGSTGAGCFQALIDNDWVMDY